jgi:hypothetical protein
MPDALSPKAVPIDLLDIAPPEISAEIVDIRGQQIRVRGLGIDEWAVLYSRFPELRALVAGGAMPEGAQQPTAQARLMAAQAALIAAGAGHLSDEDRERAVLRSFTQDDVTAAATAIIRLSLPGHVFGPLLEPGAAASRPGNESPALVEPGRASGTNGLRS